MKVLIFVNSLSAGGAERVCMNLARQYWNMGYQVCLVTLFQRESQGAGFSFEEYCLNLHEDTNKKNILLQIYKQRTAINAFVKSNEQNQKFDLIMAHLPLSHICARISDAANRTIYVQHTSLLTGGVRQMMYRLFYARVKNVCVSKGLAKEFVEDMGCLEKNVETIYNPVPIADILVLKDEKIEETHPYIICVGRLNKQKRFDRAIEIYKKGGLEKEYDLIIVGEGEEKENLKKLCDGYGIGKSVHFVGWKDNVYPWMKNASLLLHTSEKEALPMVLLEALACGTRVVASNCKYGADEILVGSMSKYVIEQENIEQYIAKIKDALLFFPLQEAKKSIHQFEAHKIAKEYLLIYSKWFKEK